MERSNDDAYNGTQNVSSGGFMEGRGSVEAQRSPQTQRLQKKRSNAGVRSTNQPQAESSALDNPTDSRGVGSSTGEGSKGRKMSIRNAVRRMFGRRSREPEPQPSQISPPRHGYHRSEQIGRARQASVPETTTEEDTYVQRTLSAPLEIMPPPVFNRTRSPYAVEFPQSARLKPLNLGNPFTAPGSQLRRRKTLPSILVAESDAVALSDAIKASRAPPIPSLELTRDTPTPDIGIATSTGRSDKRKSRSADDLRISTSEAEIAPQKRSEELRSWRESFQGSVFRASGFTVPRATQEVAEQREEDITPLARTEEDPFITRGGLSAGSTPFRRGQPTSITDVGSPSALGTELSRDLEDRVAKLEAGLRSFRGELAQMSADRNRRTVLIGGVPSSTRRRASSSGRTASMLADTLQLDLEPSSYNYEYTDPDPVRPMTSPQPQPPRTPTETDISAITPNLPLRDRAAEEPYRTPSPQAGPSRVSGARNGASQTQPPQYTFKSLYEMLTDERAARRRLERQMRGLRDEIANLNYQVSLQSNVQSQRSSYYAAMDPMVGSSRLHALLRDTETSRPGTTESQPPRESLRLDTDPDQTRVVSRFSGSDSEVGNLVESELETPYEYQTPQEEQGNFPFGEESRGSRGEGGMF